MAFEAIKAAIAEWLSGVKKSGVPVQHTIRTETGMYSRGEVPTATFQGVPIEWDVSFPHNDGGKTVTLVGHEKKTK